MRWTLLLLGLWACGTPWVESEDGAWRTLVATLRANGSGNLRFTFEPEPEESSVLVNVNPLDPDRLTHLRFLQVGDTVPYRATEEVANSNPYNRSNAAFVSAATAFNWPIQERDGALREQTHRLTIGMVDASSQYLPGEAEVGIILKRDPDLDGGTLRVNLVFGGSTVDDDEVWRAVEEAVEIWQRIYTEAAAIELDVERYQVAAGALEAPGRGDADAWEEIARSTRFGAVNVVILEEIVGFNGALGFAGNIPGPLTSTGLSAVAVSATMGAGPDGRFDERDTRLLAETMAHEVGHYLGLFHPVETSFQSWDNLDDTPSCTDGDSCLLELGDNLMYPYPVGCESPEGCLPQQKLTLEQKAVLNLYGGVL